MFSLGEFLKSGKQTKLMGIVNVSGDSFSEGSKSSADSAMTRALALLDAGADVLDIGGESTRPGAAELSYRLEMHRVLPVLEALKRARNSTIFSIDTRHVEVAEAALKSGAHIINDVSMLRNSPEIAEVVAKYDASIILNHSRGTPENMQSAKFCAYPAGVAAEVAAELAEARQTAIKCGVRPENIILDPGIGFAKTPEQCWELLRDLEQIAPLSDMVVGVSRKFFLGSLTGEKLPERRLGETLAVELSLAARGVAMLRTHAVRELHNALIVTEHLGRL